MTCAHSAQLYVSDDPAPLAFGSTVTPLHIEVEAVVDGYANMPADVQIMSAAAGLVNPKRPG